MSVWLTMYQSQIEFALVTIMQPSFAFPLTPILLSKKFSLFLRSVIKMKIQIRKPNEQGCIATLQRVPDSPPKKTAGSCKVLYTIE